MPAAAVIPAPIAYTNVVAVKTLVVEMTDDGAVYCRRHYVETPKRFGCLRREIMTSPHLP